MEIPSDLRRMPPERALAWVAGAVGPEARVTGVRRMQNAWAAAVHAVDVDDGNGDRHELVLRRWVRADIPPDDGVVENEARALSFLARVGAVRTPACVAADPDGVHADVPALVMTRLPGHDVLSPPDPEDFVEGLATTLRSIHAVTVPDTAGLGVYAPWGLERVSDAPGWSRRPEVWRRAIEVARRPIPRHTAVLCHRDFHPGNVLWHRDQISGVVDWTHTCRGPAAADVAHCRMNLAILLGTRLADDFVTHYGPVDDVGWFTIAGIVGAGAPEVWRWHDAGRTDLTVDTVIDAYDELLATALEQVT